MDYFNVAQDRYKWQTVMNTAMKFWVFFKIYLSVFFLTAVDAFQKPNAIPLCFSFVC